MTTTALHKNSCSSKHTVLEVLVPHDTCAAQLPCAILLQLRMVADQGSC